MYILKSVMFIKSNPDLFETNLQVHNTRNKHALRTVNRPNLEVARRGVHNAMIRVYNKLPSDLRDIKDINIFLKKVRGFLIQNNYYKLNEYL